MDLISNILLLVLPHIPPQCGGLNAGDPMQILTSAPQGKFTFSLLENAGQLQCCLIPPSLEGFSFLSDEAETNPLSPDEEKWPHRSPLSRLRWQRSLSLPLHPFLVGETEAIAAMVSALSRHYFSFSPLCSFFYIFKISERAQELQNQLSEIPFVNSACGDLFHILLGIWYLTCWHFIWKRYDESCFNFQLYFLTA